MAKTITWKDIANRTCVLTINDGSSGTTALTPGADPFITQIDDSDDLFQPIRTSSGNIGIVVDSVDDIVSLIGRTPISTPVTLTVGGTIRWVGFLSCESFTQEWDRGPLNIALPVMSGLEVLNGLRYPYIRLSNLGYINFAYFLVMMNNSLGGIYVSFYFPNISETDTTLTYKFRVSNYATPDDKNTTYEMATYYEILEDICKLFGWQAIEYGQSLVFLAADVKKVTSGCNMKGYTAANMESIAGGSTSVTGQLVSFDTVVPDFFGVDHRRSFVAGKNKVDVVGNLNEIPEDIWEMDVIEQCVYKSFHTTGLNLHTLYLAYYFATYQSEGSSSPNGNIRVRNSLAGGGIDTENGYNIKYYNYLNHGESAYGGSVSYERFYDYQDGEGDSAFVMRLITKAYDDSMFTAHDIHTNFLYTPSQNSGDKFYITGQIETAATAGDFFSTPSGVVYLRAVFRVGNYYYNGNDWSTTSASFVLEVLNGKINRYGYLNNGNITFKNYISAPNQTGEVMLQLLATTTTDYGPGNVYVAYENLKIRLETDSLGWLIKEKAIANPDVNENKTNLNNGFSDEWNQSCGLTLARGSVPACNGVVLKSDLTLPASLYDSKYPEKALCDRVATYAAQARMVLYAIVKGEGAMMSPLKKYAMQSGGRPWICLCQTVNWQNNEITAGFFEPSYNT